MKIVAQDSDGVVIVIADLVSTYSPPAGFTVHNLPGWDWSLADLTGVDMSQPNWISQLKWNGTTLVKK